MSRGSTRRQVGGRPGRERLSPVIRCKIRVPSAAAGMVERGRLTGLLCSAAGADVAARQVVVVTGPPGAGKTTLLADWVRGLPRVAWVTLDEGDDAATVWDALLAALAQAAGPDLPGRPARPPGAVGPDFVAEAVGMLAGLTHPVWLVLDEVEHLTDPEVVRSLDLLLRWSPRTLRLLLAGRFEPPLAFGRLRLAGRVCQIRARELNFTRSEAGELLAGHGVRVDDAGLDTLMGRTEGWAAGLRMAALSLAEAPDPAALIHDIAMDERAVADYLVGELLARMPERVRELLLRTAVCDELSAELAVELSGFDDAGEILENLCRTNALTTRVGELGSHYRYHRMLRGYLLAELARRQSSAPAALHRSAARWYAGHDDVRRGIEHAVAAGDAATVDAMVRQGGLGLVLAGEGPALGRLLGCAPAEVAALPSVGLVAAAAALERGDPQEAEALLLRIPADVPDPRAAALRAALQSRLRRRSTSCDLTRELPGLAEAGRTGDRDVDLLALLERGQLHLLLGAADAAERDLHLALRLAEDAERDHITLRCLVTLAEVALARGDVVGSAERAQAARGYATERGWQRTADCGQADLIAGHAAYQRLDRRGAAVLAAAAREAIDGGADPAGGFAAAALAAATAFDPGQAAAGAAPSVGDMRVHPEALRRAWSELEGHLEPALVAFTAVAQHHMCLSVGESGWAAEVEQHAADRLGDSGEVAVLRAAGLVHRGRSDAARRMLAPVLAGTARCVGASTLVEAWLLEAVLADAAGGAQRSHLAQAEAVRIAHPQQLLRPFHDGGRVVRGLIAGGVGRFGRDEPFVRRLLAAVPGAAPGPTERLSEREREVLTELPSLWTIEEIADNLGVSTNTIKTHLRSIYRKLDVGSRREAVATARRNALL